MMSQQNIEPDDAFAEMARLREKTAGAPGSGLKATPSATTRPSVTVAPTASTPTPLRPLDSNSALPATMPAQNTAEEALDHKDEPASGGRDFLVGVYIDEAMDNFIEHYVSRRIEGTRKKPSRSLVSFWLMQIGMQALEAQGRPAVPREFAKRRRQ